MELYIDKKRISEKLNDAFIHIILPVGMKLQVKEERERMEPEEGEEKKEGAAPLIMLSRCSAFRPHPPSRTAPFRCHPRYISTCTAGDYWRISPMQVTDTSLLHSIVQSRLRFREEKKK